MDPTSYVLQVLERIEAMESMVEVRNYCHELKENINDELANPDLD